ncbi:hypothetical protein ANANG_G00199630 [Anguilla anguilla]|uniref:Uncharacterized protein n=1 Tax=Anguilla anguilla TaxID=7936 RepID=A0A9D3M613_ANGAN|nr:hypothetical protein ANANG_G00199630 [Anguilla anguilla]
MFIIGAVICTILSLRNLETRVPYPGTFYSRNDLVNYQKIMLSIIGTCGIGVSRQRYS